MSEEKAEAPKRQLLLQSAQYRVIAEPVGEGQGRGLAVVVLNDSPARLRIEESQGVDLLEQPSWREAQAVNDLTWHLCRDLLKAVHELAAARKELEALKPPAPREKKAKA